MATIKYTLDGTDPSPTHGFVYTGPFTVPAPTEDNPVTVKAMVYGDGLEDSEITEVIYTVEPVEPEPEEPETDGECFSAICLTPEDATPTCIVPLNPVTVCLTLPSAESVDCLEATPATNRCGNDRLEDECPEGSTGEILVIPANTYFSTSTAAANILAQAALDALRAASPCVWENEEQECCNNCPEGTTGDPICVTIEAGDPRFTSTVSQEAANAAAMAQACADAAALRVLTPCIEDEEEQEPGSLWGWGFNSTGLLGMGDLAVRYTPDRVGQVDELTWVKIVSGSNQSHTMGLKEDGALYAWGTNFFGELGQGNIAAAPGSPFNLNFPTRVGAATYIDVAVGANFSAAVKSDGTLWTWGRNQSGQLAQGDTTTRSSPTQVGSATNWVRVIARGAALHAINEDGEIWIAGLTPHLTVDGGIEVDTLTQIPGTTGFFKISDAAFAQVSVGIKDDGTLWEFDSWLGAPSQLGVLTTWVDLSDLHLKKADGTLWVYDGGLTQFGVDTDWNKFSAKDGTVLAVKTNGTLWGWGFNNTGQLGQGSTDGSFTTTPVQIGPDNNWVNVGNGPLVSFGMRGVLTAPPPPATATGIAEGGSIILAGGYAIHRFDWTHDLEIVNGTGKTFEWWMIGGGGEGGGLGGGSGGEILTNSGSLADGIYPVVVGAGGRHPLPQFETADTLGFDGGDTTFNGDTAPGGKGGGGFGTNLNGQNGTATGSGAGCASPIGSGNGTGGTGTFTGGNGSSTASFGLAGGGGAGTTGNGANATSTGTSSTGGAGGTGTLSNFGGAGNVRYGAGGGGGAGSAATQTGGAGGNSVGGIGGITLGGVRPGSAGLTPGSGGGGGTGSLPFDAGSGARGVFFIRYPYP